jgi:hypothetical protein
MATGGFSLQETFFQVHVCLPGDPNVGPTLSCRRAVEEQMIDSLILPWIAHDTSVVLPFSYVSASEHGFSVNLSTSINQMKNFTLGVHWAFQMIL